jgi:hypothetical protein
MNLVNQLLMVTESLLEKEIFETVVNQSGRTTESRHVIIKYLEELNSKFTIYKRK